MFKLLFAEDERETREGILEGIPWEELGISQVRSAKNGMAALLLAQTFLPDILLTDIRMPKMNGIQLANEVRSLNPGCSILIISGYADKAYLKSAIALHAVDYIDKPVALEVLKEQLQAAVSAQQERAGMQALLRRNLAQLLRKNQPNLVDIQDTVRKIFSKAPQELYCQTFLIRIFSRDIMVLSEYLLQNALRQILPGLTGRYGMVVADVAADTISCSVLTETAGSLPGQDFLHFLETQLPEHKIYLFCGQPMAFPHFTESFVQAQEMLRDSFYDESQKVWDQVQPRQTLPEVDLQPFIQAVNNLDETATLGFIHQLTQRLCAARALAPNEAVYVYLQLFSILRPNLPEAIFDLLANQYFIQQLSRQLTESVQEFFAEKIKNETFPIHQILHEVETGYNDPAFSLNHLSKVCYLSNVYISTKFKQCLGITFSKYLRAYRLKKAVELLLGSNESVHMIAQQVGFDNGSYFTKVFKQEKGVTPAEYRKLKRKI